MPMIRASFLICLVFAIQMMGQWMASPPAALAEWFVDAYGGAALPQQAQASHTQIDPIIGTTTRQLDFGAGPSLGLRMGMWFASPLPWIGKAAPWLGIAGDVSYFERKSGSSSITASPISALIMVRLPIFPSDEFPGGRFQPYVGAGPSFVIGRSSVDVSPLTKTEDSNISAGGLDARAGLLWYFHKNFAFFGEYKWNYFSITTSDERCPPPPQPCRAIPSDAVTVRETHTNLSVYHALIGLRFTIR